MVGAPAAADAVARARTLPNLRVGLHIVLTDGAPVSDRREIPGLIGRHGEFRNDLALYGAIIGFIVARTGVSSLVLTVCMLIGLRGLALVLVPQRDRKSVV